MPDQLTVIVELVNPLSSADRLDDLALRLREEIVESGLGRAEAVHSTAASPPGAKGEISSEVAITVILASYVLPNLVILIKDWLLRQREQTLRAKIDGVEIEVPRDVTDAEVERIVGIVLSARNASK